MRVEPFELKCIKREIEKARSSTLPVGLTKITIHTSDAIWLVRQVENLQKISEAWNTVNSQKTVKESVNKGNLLDVMV